MRHRHVRAPVPVQSEPAAVPPAAPLGHRLFGGPDDNAEVGASLFDVATQPQSAFYEALVANYHKALEYYDNTTGPAEHARA